MALLSEADGIGIIISMKKKIFYLDFTVVSCIKPCKLQWFMHLMHTKKQLCEHPFCKSSTLVGFSIVNHPFWGIPIYGKPHIHLDWWGRPSRSAGPWSHSISIGLGNPGSTAEPLGFGDHLGWRKQIMFFALLWFMIYDPLLFRRPPFWQNESKRPVDVHYCQCLVPKVSLRLQSFHVVKP